MTSSSPTIFPAEKGASLIAEGSVGHSPDEATERLNTAASLGAANGVSASLADGADALWADDCGRDALMRATNAGSASCVKILLPLSNPLRADNWGGTALAHAAASGSVECVALLLPVSDSRHADQAGHTALHIAVVGDKPEIIGLLAPASDCAAEDARGRDALALAAFNARPECLRALLPFSNANRRNADGMTALNWALEYGERNSQEGLECLGELMAASDLSAIDGGGWDALSGALLKTRSDPKSWITGDIMRLFLLHVDAKAPITGKKGLTHLMVATSGGLTEEAFDLLLAASDPLAATGAGLCALTQPMGDSTLGRLKKHPAYKTLEGQKRILSALLVICGVKEEKALCMIADSLRIGPWGREEGAELMRQLQRRGFSTCADQILALADDDAFDALREAYLRELLPMANRRAESRLIERAAREGERQRAKDGVEAPARRKPKTL